MPTPDYSPQREGQGDPEGATPPFDDARESRISALADSHPSTSDDSLPIVDATLPKSTAPTVTYTFSRFCFKADAIEPLAMTDTFRMITTRHGTFQMTKEEFYRDFPKVRETRSYREGRLHHSPTVSRMAARYRISG